MADIRQPLLDAVDAAAIAESAATYFAAHPTNDEYGVTVTWSNRSGLSSAAFYAMQNLVSRRVEQSMASLLAAVVAELRADARTKLAAARAALVELIEGAP